MSEILDALYSVDDGTPPDRDETSGREGAPARRAGFVTEAPTGQEKKLPADSTRSNEVAALLTARLEASRAHLEADIVDARRVRQGWEQELKRSQLKIQESSLGALRVAAAGIKADILSEIESRSQAGIEQAVKRLEEKSSAAMETVEAALQKSLDAFGKKLSEISATLLEAHCARMGRAMDHFQFRVEQAAQAAGGREPNSGACDRFEEE